jgi:hypothetical protein
VLKALKITYINSPTSYPDGTQRVKYPADAIGLMSANCIDGTLLFASALENIGLNPQIVITREPGHAFLAWETWPGSGIVDCLETTWLNTATFEAASTEGRRKYNVEINAGNFGNGKSEVINIKTERARGYNPLMKRVAN